MFDNISLFTGLWILWFFVTGLRSEIYFSNLTRDDLDIFSNTHCANCSEYGATDLKGSCKCNIPRNELCPDGLTPIISGSVFLRSQRKCISDCDFKGKRAVGCFSWENEAVKVINVDSVNSKHKFQQKKFKEYQSCQWTKSIEFLDAEENWKPVNVSANAFQVLKDSTPQRYLEIKITEQSAALASLRGHVMKIGLNCTRSIDNGSDPRCLVFKSAGQLNFPLCNYTVPAMPNTTLTRLGPCPVTPVISTWAPSIAPSTTTCTPSSSVKPPPPQLPPPPPQDYNAIIAAIVPVGSVLCFSIAYLLYRYKRQSSRDLREGEVNDFAVIANLGPQTYRVSEEPLYVELPDVDPSNTLSTGNSAKIFEGKQTVEDSVLLNPYVGGASFTRVRHSTDPLPSRPDNDEKTRPQNFGGRMYQNDGCGHDEEVASLVVENPRVQESFGKSLPRAGNDLDRLPEAPKKKEVESELQHQPSHETADGNEEHSNYRGLLIGKRAQSMFICPSCNKNPDYQRLSLPVTCPHGRTDERSQKCPSFYESLALERGTRESSYASPSQVDAQTVEDENKCNNDVTPEYHTLEPDETEASQEPDKLVAHDYNVLEEPEQTCNKFDEDNNELCDNRPAEEDPEMPCEPSRILNMENNPAYAVPSKKKDTEGPVRKRSYSM